MLANLPKNITSVNVRNLKGNYSYTDRFITDIDKCLEKPILDSQVRFLENNKGCLVITCDFDYIVPNEEDYKETNEKNNVEPDYSYLEYMNNKNAY